MYHRLLGLGLEIAGTFGSFWQRVEELKRLQWLPSQRLEERQLAKLKSLLNHAYANVPIYRKKFREAEILPEEIRTAQDFARIPIVTKEELRTAFPDQVTARTISFQRYATGFTSGSTSTPFQFYSDIASNDERRASLWLFNSWFGYMPGEKRLYIGNIKKKPPLARLRDRIARNYEIHVADIPYEKIARVLTRIDKIRPSHLEGFPSSLALLARSMLEEGLETRSKLSAVISVSERLLKSQRDYIESAFRCPVIDRYGLCELGGIVSQQCQRDSGFHTNTELCLLEVVDESGKPCRPGREGRLVVTDLHNFVMPFIRYYSGDLGTSGGMCACGRGFPTVDKICGRELEFVRKRGGEKISLAPYIEGMYKYAPYVMQFQFEQKTNGKLVIIVVPGPKFSKAVESAIVADLGGITEDLIVECDQSSQIDLEVSGKRLFLKRKAQLAN
jgi:phenylacetate-CoA ligase